MQIASNLSVKYAREAQFMYTKSNLMAQARCSKQALKSMICVRFTIHNKMPSIGMLDVPRKHLVVVGMEEVTKSPI